MMRMTRELGVETVRRRTQWRLVLATTADQTARLGAIGVRVSRRVTMHGFLQLRRRSRVGDNIVACGIADAGVSSISREAGRTVTVQDLMPYAEKHINRRHGLSLARPTAYAVRSPARGVAAVRGRSR